MKFQSLLSPKQIFTVKGIRYKANQGFLETEDKNVIEHLSNNQYWKSLDKPKVEKSKVEKVKKVKKD